MINLKIIDIALIGGGGRGKAYTDYALQHPEKFKVTALAEPCPEKRNCIKKLHNIPDNCCFSDWKELLNREKTADIAMICTQDDMHFAPAVEAIKKGYNLLLEKPIAPTPIECEKISQLASYYKSKVVVCHVLRYTPFYRYIKDFIDNGKLGRIINIVHIEGVGNTHQSHSYVRGNWRNSKTSAPMILTKSCHDIDLLQWLIGKKCIQINSYGSLSYFNKQHAPDDAPDYCMDGCVHKDDCFYYSPLVYDESQWAGKYFRGIVANKFNPTDEEVNNALRRGPYGRCIFKCDNNVVDHQIVNMQFEDDIDVSFTMSAFNKGGRKTIIMGTGGELTADMDNCSITFYNFATCETEILMKPDNNFDDTITGGHGGGDEGLMSDLYDYFANDIQSKSISDIDISCYNHLLAFAAEKARVENRIIDIEEYRKMQQ